MKKFVFASALAIALAGTVAVAQDPAPAPAPAPAAGKHMPNPHKMAAKMATELSLTDDQKAKIEPILVDRQQKMQALMADSASDEGAKKKQGHAIMKKSNEDIAAILTPEQQEKMKSMHKGHKGGGANE